MIRKYLPAFPSLRSGSFLCLALMIGWIGSLGGVAPHAQAREGDLPTLYLIGDSTVNNGTKGQRGWGSELQVWIDPARVKVVNRARGGRSSRTFYTEGLWRQVEESLKPGDFVLMQFGHNDGGSLDDPRNRASLKGIGEETRTITRDGKSETVHTYGWYLRRFVTAAREKGAAPIVLSPVPRNIWIKETGKVARAAGDYGLWARQVAEAEKVPFLDLNEIVAARYEADGPSLVAERYFGPTDHTHTTEEGARITAACLASALAARKDPTLAKLQQSILPRPAGSIIPPPECRAERQLERLGRGVVVLVTAPGHVFVSWRLLNTDPENAAFNLYRTAGSGSPIRVNPMPLTGATCFVDTGADLHQALAYFVRPVVDGRELEASGAFRLPADAPPRPYLRLPLRTPAGYTPNDASVGDLDGDGEYEIILHQAGRGHDNSQSGPTDPPLLQAYKLDGTLLWEINLGHNIREGAHYTQFLVYDLDGDGRAEVVCKTADGTVDGAGKVIGDARADWRNASGYVLDGPEFLTVFDGATGRNLATTPYIPPRGRVADWGDNYGNRVDRFLACVAYLDGRHPSVVMCRGYYTRTVLAAWDWRSGKLTQRWVFDSDAPGNQAYAGQGNHNLAVGDVDGDGKDEIVYGAMCVDDNGKGLYSTGLGHGDALHLSDLDPSRPGLEVFDIHEKPKHLHGVEFRDARTGKVIWSKPSTDVGRGVALDIDPRSPGCEMWASGPGLSGVWNVKGETISERKPRACNFGVWWDGDLLRELLDGITITKWNWETGSETPLLTAEGCRANNSTKSTPCLCADILGDWREEVLWRSEDGQELRIYTTLLPTEHRLCTLMQDPQYRLSVAWQNAGYNQPTQPGFFLGAGMAPRKK